MAVRPFAFGAHFRERGRSVRVQVCPDDPRRYAVEVRRGGRRVHRREHASLTGALREFAAAWRARLH